jgi:hypothetical protein
MRIKGAYNLNRAGEKFNPENAGFGRPRETFPPLIAYLLVRAERFLFFSPGEG